MANSPSKIQQRLKQQERNWMRAQLQKPTLSCPSCQRLISTRAAACPRCGVPLQADLWLSTLRKRFRQNVITGAIALGVVGTSLMVTVAMILPKALTITSEGYGSKWPFPGFEEATLRCERVDGLPAVTIELGGKSYALNGVALDRTDLSAASLMMARQPGTQDLSADGRGVIDANASGALIQLGTTLC